MSFNSLLGLGSNSAPSTLVLHAPCLDDAANTDVLDYSGNSYHGTLSAGNTSVSSTTGPNNWLSKSLDFDYGDYVDFPSTVHDDMEATNNFTVYVHHDLDATYSTRSFLDFDGGLLEVRSGTYRSWLFSASGNLVNVGSAAAIGWATLASTWSGATLTHYEDGSSTGSTGTSRSFRTGSGVVRLARRQGGQDPTEGRFAGVMIWSDDLTSSEITELENGPEPVVVSGLDSVSGTASVGSTLSASGATWGLDSPYGSGTNGTITYSYQWTRSDDGTGTNEADISGATSSTYTTVSADVGKYIRRRTRGTNDGGSDTTSDHNSTFTSAITAAGRPTLTLTGVGR
jgi:hypothetical protein